MKKTIDTQTASLSVQHKALSTQQRDNTVVDECNRVQSIAFVDISAHLASDQLLLEQCVLGDFVSQAYSSSHHPIR